MWVQTGARRKFLLVRTIKVYRGSVGIAPQILNLSSSWSTVINFTPTSQQLYPRGKDPSSRSTVGPTAGPGITKK